MSSRCITTETFIITTGYDRQLESFFFNIFDNRLDEHIFDSLLLSDSRILEPDSIKIILRGFGVTIDNVFWEEFKKDPKRSDCGRLYRGYDLTNETIQIGTEIISQYSDARKNKKLTEDEIVEAKKWFNRNIKNDN